MRMKLMYKGEEITSSSKNDEYILDKVAIKENIEHYNAVITDIATANTPMNTISEINAISTDAIYGFDNVILTHSGKNLFDYEFQKVMSNGYSPKEIGLPEDGWSVAMSSNVTYNVKYPLLPCKPGTYIFSLELTDTNINGWNIIVVYNYSTKKFTSNNLNGSAGSAQLGKLKVSFTVPENSVALFRINGSTEAIRKEKFFDCVKDIQLERGSVGTEYEPFQGGTYIQKLPTTIYGGAYDWTKGKLTVTHTLTNGELVELSEPEVSILTNHEILALNGTNILTSNCGDTSVEFYADTKKYIDKKIDDLRNELQT